MRTRSETTANLIACFDVTEDLIDGLSDDQWATQSLCPDWDVRGVIEHLAGIEYALSGWRPAGADQMPPFGRIAEFLSEVAGISNEELAQRTRSIFADRRQELAAMSDDEFEAMTGTPVGPGTYRRFMDVRVFDFWVHIRDITTPLGLPTDDSGPAAECTLDEIEASVGYIVGKRIGLDDGMGIRFTITGPVERTIDAQVVEGKAAGADHLDSPDVTLSVDALTFIQLACGRIDPEGAIDRGAISWAGDDEWGRKAATSLRFTR